MIKLVAALSQDAPNAPAARHRVLPADPTDAVLAAIAGRATRAQPHRALLLAWPLDEAECAAAERVLAPAAAVLLRCEEVVHWDELGESEGEAIVLSYFVRRRPGLAFADFAAHYRERHAPLARTHHPGIARYVQSFRADAGDEAAAVDAVSELWFRSERDARERFYRDDESRRVIAEDVARFLDLRAGFAFAARAPSGP